MTERVDPTSVQVLRELPRRHRSYLLNKYPDEIKRSWAAQRKYECLAQLIGPRNISRYANLYLPGNGSSFVWFKFEEENKSLDVHAIFNRISRAHPGIQAGLFPDLEEDQPPRLHRMLNYGDYIAIEYASKDATRTFVRNWKAQKIHVDRVYRIVIRNDPFTIEVRATGVQRQHMLLQMIANEAHINVDDALRCDLSPKRNYDRLDKKLKARFSDSHLRCSTDGLSGMRLSAALDKRMDESTEWKHQMDQEGREETQRYYEFETIHPDGYPEITWYSVDLASGDLRLAARASERAAENLRQHVIEIFK